MMTVRKNGEPQEDIIYGRFRVGTNHPTFAFEEVFYCEPSDNEVCNDCKFRYSCFSDEEVIVAFNGCTLGIFPPLWHNPTPLASELEIYLFGRRTYLMTLRESWRECKIAYNK